MAKWTPADLPSDVVNQLWLDAGDSDNTISDDGTTMTFADKGDYRHDFIQATADYKPTINSAGQNFLNTLLFAGDYLTSYDNAGFWKFLHDGTIYHLFLVAKLGSSADPDAAVPILGTNAATSSNIGAAFWYEDRSSIPTNETLRCMLSNGTTGNYPINQTATESQISPNTFGLVQYSLDPSNATAASRGSISVNAGTADESNATTYAVSTSSPTYNAQLGGLGTAAFSSDMEFCEMLIVSGNVTSDIISKIQGYLIWRWGLNAEIPTAHSYVNYCPGFYPPAVTSTNYKVTPQSDHILKDAFTGADGDLANPALWILNGSESDVRIESNQLMLSLVASSGRRGLWSRFLLSGDFDIQVYFSESLYPAVSQHLVSLLVGSKFLTYTDYIYIAPKYNSGSKFSSAVCLSGTATTASVTRTITEGYLRLTRVGSVGTIWYSSDGENWTQMQTGTMSTALMRVEIYASSDVSVTADWIINNFKINIGTLVWDNSDNFVGADSDPLNSRYWETSDAVISGNKGLMPYGVSNGINGKFGITGDFSVQIDFGLLSATADNGFEFDLILLYDTGYYGIIRFIRTSSSSLVFQSVSCIGGTLAYESSGVVSVTTGRIKIERSGSVWTFLYDSGVSGTWVTFATTRSIGSGMVYPRILQSQWTNVTDAQFNFSKFIINYGTVVWPVIDSFGGTSGDDPNADIWTRLKLRDATGSALLGSGGVALTFASTDANGSPELLLKKKAIGDFTMVVDFTAATFSGTSGWMSLGLSIDNGSSFIYVAKGNTTLRFWGGAASVYVTRTNDYGGLRIRRVGTTAYYEYRDGAGAWTQLTTLTVDDGPMIVGLSGLNQNSGITCSAIFDNFWLYDEESTIIPTPQDVLPPTPLYLKANRVPVNGDMFFGEDGDSVDSNLWTVSSGAFTISSNKALGSVGVNSVLKSNFNISGDFQVLLDFLKIAGAEVDGYSVFINCYVDANNWCSIRLARGTTKIWQAVKCVSGTYTYYGSTSASVNAGKLRMVRTGTTFYFQYDSNNNGVFATITTQTLWSTDMYFQIGYQRWGSTTDMQCSFDAFTIVKGTIVWPSGTPVIGSGNTNYDLVKIFEKLSPTNDDFTGSNGSVPNEVMWLSRFDSLDGGGSEGTIEIYDNKLHFELPDSTITLPCAVGKFAIVGNFDISISFSMAATPSTDEYWMFGLNLRDSQFYTWAEGNSDYVYIHRDTASRGPYRAGAAVDGATLTPTNSITQGGSADLSGELRIVKIGNLIYTFTKTSGSWNIFNMFLSANFVDSFRVWLIARRWSTAGGYLDCSIDDFKINHGSVVFDNDLTNKLSITSSDKGTEYPITKILWDSVKQQAEIYAKLPPIDSTDYYVMSVDNSQDDSNLVEDSFEYLPSDFDDLVTWDFILGVTYVLSKLIQPYYLGYDPVRSVIKQLYSMVNVIVVNYLTQPYAILVFSQLMQTWTPAPFIISSFYQWWRTAPYVRSTLLQEYSIADFVISYLLQGYSIEEIIKSMLSQTYHLFGAPAISKLPQQYQMLSYDEVISKLRQSYAMLDSLTGSSPQAVVKINGVQISITGFDFEHSISNYAIFLKLYLIDYDTLSSIEYFDEVEFTIFGVTYNLVVTLKPSDEQQTSKNYYAECRSATVLLDTPYTSELENDDDVYGTASEICNRVLAPYGHSIIWELPIDPIQTINTFSVSGMSPLQAVRSLVNELGGKLYTDNEGQLHAVEYYEIDTDKYDTATIVTEYSQSGLEYLSIEDDIEDNFNYFVVSNDESEVGHSLRDENITYNHKKIRASQVPWSSENRTLSVSKLSGVTLSYAGIKTEEIEEVIEIKEGEGSVQYPMYGIISFEYDDTISLGDVTYTESGTITTEIQKETMLTIKYITKYREWDVYSTTSDKVQFILD